MTRRATRRPAPKALAAPTQISPLGPTSEECLYLNIWSPLASAGDAKRPVIRPRIDQVFALADGAAAIRRLTEHTVRGKVVVTMS